MNSSIKSMGESKTVEDLLVILEEHAASQARKSTFELYQMRERVVHLKHKLLEGLVSQLTPFAFRLVEDEFETASNYDVQSIDEELFVLIFSRSSTGNARQVTLDPLDCPCSFHCGHDLPCRHMLCYIASLGLTPEKFLDMVMASCHSRWRYSGVGAIECTDIPILQEPVDLPTDVSDQKKTGVTNKLLELVQLGVLLSEEALDDLIREFKRKATVIIEGREHEFVNLVFPQVKAAGRPKKPKTKSPVVEAKVSEDHSVGPSTLPNKCRLCLLTHQGSCPVNPSLALEPLTGLLIDARARHKAIVKASGLTAMKIDPADACLRGVVYDGIDIDGDGHCGFRAIAHHIYGHQVTGLL